jgi:hypothetical protein
MNAIQLLRTMHVETKLRFKVILGTDDPVVADQGWRALQPVLRLHEELEDEFLYKPLQTEFGLGTPLGDWIIQHDADVTIVEQLVAGSAELAPGTPEWKMCIATVMDVLSKHVTDEENQIFGRVEQVWAPPKLEQLGEQMQEVVSTSMSTQPTRTKSTPARPRR